jgi:mRNA-degrading endonuclease toxin of MazEF toxin-antitoxin module
MKRGEVYWADLVPRSGSEQTGRRPVVVVDRAKLTRRIGSLPSGFLFEVEEGLKAAMDID